MAADPEYAAMVEARKAEYNRRHTEKRRLAHEALSHFSEDPPPTVNAI